MLNEIKWATRQRLQYIELMAYYTGVVTRSDVAKAFAISDAAATKDLKFYNDIAPENLIYKHAVFGFVPSSEFKEVFADLSPATVLSMIESNLTVAGGPNPDESVFGIPVESMILPSRLPDKTVFAQISRAIHGKKKCQVSYHSLSNKESTQKRMIEPHSLVNTGFRWHVRAYNEDTFDFRDFVLSRFVSAECLDADAESSAQYDDDWSEIISVQLTPHPKLDKEKQSSLLIDYGSDDDVITIKVRRALIGYLLQQLSVDTTADHELNPNKYQLIVLNRDEIEPFAGWAFS
ncbi:MAG TPA: WYL domain-containing protein [Thiotrichaceae bacterium]|nr:WYL domain-containing protein [Thiotrichaceae bacterium]HIM07719.1 WYL domain-containing protein [Gammaproteobacteria bacterium]